MNRYLTLSALALFACTVSTPTNAASTENCRVEVAVSTPPVQFDQNVVFNITSNDGMNKSITLKGGSAPRYIDDLACSPNINYLISATMYSTPSNKNASKFTQPIGQCPLKAGAVKLSLPGNSVSVVFPQDFACNF